MEDKARELGLLQARAEELYADIAKQEEYLRTC